MSIIYIATKNKGKVEEFQQFFQKFHITVKSLLDIDRDIDIKETGKTFLENAKIKAETLCKIVNKAVLADDSGLEVDILNNDPGIYSARYAGINCTPLDNNLKLLANLQDVPFEKRKGRFVCALAVVYPSGKEISVVGTCEGYINDKMQGDKGFGYDPLFYVPAYRKTFAELSKEEKMKISHRGQALKKLEKVFLHDKNRCCE